MFAITAGTLGHRICHRKNAGRRRVGAGRRLRGESLRQRPRFSPTPCASARRRRGCGCGPSPFSGQTNWRFWGEADRHETFRATALENALFLTKWLVLAYLIEALMLEYVPADWIAGVLGGNGVFPIVLGALVGAPAYLNGYAAVPLVDALLAQGDEQRRRDVLRHRRRRQLYPGGDRRLGTGEATGVRGVSRAGDGWSGAGRDCLERGGVSSYRKLGECLSAGMRRNASWGQFIVQRLPLLVRWISRRRWRALLGDGQALARRLQA